MVRATYYKVGTQLVKADVALVKSVESYQFILARDLLTKKIYNI